MINYNAHDIERYLNRQMNAAEMHAFERAMMDDPMLADAVDGYRLVYDERNLQADLAELKTKLNPDKENGKVVAGFFRPWMSMAAVAIILLTAAVLFYRYQNETTTQPIATLDQKQTTPPEIKETVVDSNTVAVNDQKTIPSKPSPEKPGIITPPVKEEKNKPVINNDVAVVDTKDKEPAAAIAAAPPPPVVASAETADHEAEKKQAELQKKSEAKLFYNNTAKAKAPPAKTRLNRFSGIVLDEQNNPLPFANVTEVNSRVGTYADAKGNFTLVAEDTVLNIETRSVGYTTSNVLLRNNQQQKIVLKDEAIIAGAPSRNDFQERYRNRTSAIKGEVTEMETEPVDGWNKYSTYVLNNLRLPEADERRRFKETEALQEVELSFDVNPDGSIANIKVERSTCTSCNTEAIRVVKEGPKWKSKSGKKERARFTVQF
nr:carboxypeptidase-like regulatory domain-containing protein [uncultured Lacibacter sp.]